VRRRLGVSRLFWLNSPTQPNSYCVALAGGKVLKQKTYGHFKRDRFQRSVALARFSLANPIRFSPEFPRIGHAACW
jgi:hypothetical protein